MLRKSEKIHHVIAPAQKPWSLVPNLTASNPPKRAETSALTVTNINNDILAGLCIPCREKYSQIASSRQANAAANRLNDQPWRSLADIKLSE
jgi:hypothetical protein